jgi:hypothetical protein
MTDLEVTKLHLGEPSYDIAAKPDVKIISYPVIDFHVVGHISLDMSGKSLAFIGNVSIEKV